MIIRNQHIKIRDCCKTDQDQVKEIAEMTFGSGYWDDALFTTSQNAILRVLETKGVVAGFTYSQVLTREACQSFLPKAYHTNDVQNGLIKTLAVDPKMQGKGFGDLLLEDSIQILQKYPIEGIFCIAWQKEGQKGINGMLYRKNFQFLMQMPEFWKEDSLKRNYHCPICGQPCLCAAHIFRKKLK